MRTQQRRLAAILVASAALLGTVTAATPAHAAPVIECQNVNGAPAIEQVSSFSLRAYYYHQCNVSPAAAGVVTMHSFVGYQFERDSNAYGAWHMNRTQQSAAYNFTGGERDLQMPEGYYRAVNQLRIYGTFTYGSHPGCGRVASDEVVCTWLSGWKYMFPGSAAAVHVAVPDVANSTPGGVFGVALPV